MGIGWRAKPAAVEVQAAESKAGPGRKARIAESKSRVKMVTSVVTNIVHNTITNTGEIVREQRRGPEAWREEM